MEETISEPVQLSFLLPRSLDTKVHLRLTIKSKVILLFLTTMAADEGEQAAPMGSFVYALPNVCILRPGTLTFF